MPIAFPCCGCAQILRVPDAMAGRKGKCPKCGAANVIPPADQVQAETPRPRPAARKPASRQDVIEEKEVRRKPAPTPTEPEEVADDEADGEGTEEARPRKGRKAKKKGKSPALLIGLIGGGGCGLLLLCSGVGALAWWLFFSGGIGDELKYMPNNCQFVASIRFNELMQSNALKELRKEAPDIDQQMKMAEMTKETGIASEDIEQMVFGGSGSGPKDLVIVMRTRKAVNAADLRSRIQNASYTETKVGKYVLNESGNSNGPSFCVVDKKMLVLGEKEPIRAVLTRDKRPEFSKNLQDAMKKTDFSRTIAFATDLKGGASKPGGIMPVPGMDGGMDKANSLAVNVKVASDVRLDLTILCPDAKSAEDIKKVIDGLLTMMRSNKGAPKELTDLLDVSLKVDGSNVVGSKSFKVGPLIQAYKQQKVKPF